jgi:predicted O-methyltransferase YrrM
MKSLNRKDLTVVEIGTDKGYNAKTILDNLNVGKIYLIDPYLGDGKQGGKASFEMAKRRLCSYKNMEFIKKKSEEAINDVPNGIDFLYIDGEHSKKQVAMELELYYPKMKTMGVIAGHDYCGMHIDLTEAVAEFAKKHTLRLFGGSIDFWMIKS